MRSPHALLLALLLSLSLSSPALALPSFRAPVVPKVASHEKGKLGRWIPKVRFQARAKLKRTSVKVGLEATIAFGTKTLRVPVFDLTLVKTRKSIRVKRKVGKLRVSLTVSWAGARTITIRGTARYLKLKVPMPKIRLKV